MKQRSYEAVLIVEFDGTIVHISSAASGVFGRSAKGLLGQSVFSLMPARIREGQRKLWERVPPVGTSLRIDALGLRDGKEVPLKIELTEVPGTPPVRCVIIEDLTPRVTVLSEAQKMEALGRLAGGVAHDFNNALMAITGLTEFVRDELPAGTGLEEDLDEVLGAAANASRLTAQLLSFARRRQVETSVIDLRREVLEMETLLRRTLPASISLEVSTSEDRVHVRFARSELHQVVLNLANNARDAMPNGGKLSVKLTSRSVVGASGLADGEYAVLSVCDTGDGIAESVADKIFDPFFSTKGEAGTGLGLATCHKIASQIGGTIEVASVVGTGSTFSLFIPICHQVPEPVVSQTAKLRVRSHQGVAMVVEDQPAMRKIMARAMGRLGMEPLVAESAEEAITLTESLKSPLSFLLTDYNLPGKTGADLATMLRNTNPALKVIVTSGYVGAESIRELLAEPNTSFLQKPFSPKELRHQVNSLLFSEQ